MNTCSHYLERIDKRYNPEFDIPEPPEVTWADYNLLLAIQSLQITIQALQTRIDTLEETVLCPHNEHFTFCNECNGVYDEVGP
jgi:hypothetical protein